MHLWALSSVLLVVAAIALANQSLDQDAKSASLRSALEAVSQRQRDIASGKQFFGLGSYREEAGDLSFLAQDNDPPTGDGQPENIGYGFQKLRTNQHSYGEPQSMNDEIEDEERKMFEKLAVEFLNEEFQKIDDANNQYYQAGGEKKRSSFRERELPERYSSVPGKVRNGLRKRTSFRERNHKETDDEKRRRIMNSINRRMGHELEEPLTEDDDEYARIIQTLWERCRESYPKLVDVEQLSESDVDTLLNYLEDNGSGPTGPGADGPEMKRAGVGDGRQGAGYAYKDFIIQKRGKQLLEDDEVPSNAFLYSLKFVSPEYNREAVEQMRDMEGIDTSGENDADILRLGLKSFDDPERSDDDEWHGPARSEQEMEEYGQEDPLQNFLPHSEHSRKRFNLASYKHSIGVRRKRFPVAKRSPEPRNYGQDALEYGRIRMKKSAQGESHTTDPKVASELSHIFEPATNENTNKLTPLIIGNHVVTKQKVVPTTTLPPKVNSSTIEMTVIVNVNRNENVSSVEPSHLNEEIEQPVAMSRLEAPIEIKKKSVDWTDYFGLDKRRKKTGPPSQIGNGIAGDDSWLVDQYYKSMASAASEDKAKQRDKKDVHLAAQPFDTRFYDESNFQKSLHQPIFNAKKDHVSEVDEARIDKMDMKLRNIEDVIINEAVKYTGAHEGSTDSKEVQEVKDRVISRLAAAYNLEKMRKALSEFKSSLLAQKMSKYNPENGNPVEVEEKRGGLSKLKLGDDKKPNSGINMKQGYRNGDSDINGPLVENMSEGYMGGLKNMQNERHANECPIFASVLKVCRNVEVTVGFADYDFLSLCTLHQICYVCGSEVGSESMSACDEMFLDKAETMCRDDVSCEKSSLRWMMALKHRRASQVLEVGTRCWENFCTSQPVVDMAR